MSLQDKRALSTVSPITGSAAKNRMFRWNDNIPQLTTRTGYQLARQGILIITALCVAALPVFAQTATKLRVLTAPGITQNQAPKDWHNTFGVADGELVLTCPKCTPIQVVKVKKDEIATIRYGQNAYHHWAAGIITGVFSLGVGAIVGFMPHHQHFFSVDLKSGRAVGIQADKSDYKQIAGMLINYSAMPIHVTPKDAHFLAGFNTVIDTTGSTSTAK